MQQQSEEARRYVLEGVMAGDLRASQAAEILGVSERHAWRLLAAYRARGAAALEHGNRGRRPHNAVAAAAASAVVRFASTRYPGANHTHLAGAALGARGPGREQLDRPPDPGAGRHRESPPAPAARAPCPA